uniref:Uncharacterized protein n=1 Tax=viral metagenome TaxID=1070528 RepID=A0A6H1ZUA4_9ZZZZ
MTIDKALEVLAVLTRAPGIDQHPQLFNAVNLGIEALRQVKYSRFDPSTWEPRPLPGETD